MCQIRISSIRGVVPAALLPIAPGANYEIWTALRAPDGLSKLAMQCSACISNRNRITRRCWGVKKDIQLPFPMKSSSVLANQPGSQAGSHTAYSGLWAFFSVVNSPPNQYNNRFACLVLVWTKWPLSFKNWLNLLGINGVSFWNGRSLATSNPIGMRRTPHCWSEWVSVSRGTHEPFTGPLVYRSYPVKHHT